MAKMEGPDVENAIRKDPVLKEMPTIFLTATVTQKEVDEGNGMIGGHPFVAKPSNLETLLEAIDKNMMAI
jgi:CheY-like chemotaxis protein